MMKRRTLYIGALVLAAGLGGAALLTSGGSPSTSGAGNDAVSDWRTAELTDVRTGETFTIDSFDRPVLLESFAVWCPTCTRQQKEIQTLHDQVGDDIVSVSINTDTNEGPEKVRNHVERHGFDGQYVIASPSFLRALINDFGRSFVNAPLAPMVVVCPDGTAERLDDGVKPASTLQQAVQERC